MDAGNETSVREAASRGLLRRSGMGAGLPHPSAQKVQNIILYFRGNFFRTDGTGDRDGFLIGIQEMNTVRTDPQMLLKISLDTGPQVVVQIVEYQVTYLFAVLIGQ
jgi:hypothetical protein